MVGPMNIYMLYACITFFFIEKPPYEWNIHIWNISKWLNTFLSYFRVNFVVFVNGFAFLIDLKYEIIDMKAFFGWVSLSKNISQNSTKSKQPKKSSQHTQQFVNLVIQLIIFVRCCNLCVFFLFISIVWFTQLLSFEYRFQCCFFVLFQRIDAEKYSICDIYARKYAFLISKHYFSYSQCACININTM